VGTVAEVIQELGLDTKKHSLAEVIIIQLQKILHFVDDALENEPPIT
jgi:hypothetical protein